jgi:hypothetical protein
MEKEIMLQEDEQVLVSLVKSYPPADILSALVSAFREHRDELSDMGIKDRAKELAEVADLVGEIRDVMSDSGI